MLVCYTCNINLKWLINTLEFISFIYIHRPTICAVFTCLITVTHICAVKIVLETTARFLLASSLTTTFAKLK